MDQGLGAVTASINGWLHPPCADFYSGEYWFYLIIIDKFDQIE